MGKEKKFNYTRGKGQRIHGEVYTTPFFQLERMLIFYSLIPEVEKNVDGKRVEKEDEMDQSDDPDEG